MFAISGSRMNAKEKIFKRALVFSKFQKNMEIMTKGEYKGGFNSRVHSGLFHL